MFKLINNKSFIQNLPMPYFAAHRFFCQYRINDAPNVYWRNVCSLALGLVCCLILAGCGDDAANGTRSSVNSAQNLHENAPFAGCYSVEKDAGAQILINGANGSYTMQMKEVAGGWDNAEPLDSLPRTDGYKRYFASNAIGLKSADLQGEILARPDGVMALGWVDGANAALNPAIDSTFVVALFGAVNTIYRVECDDVAKSVL